MSEAAELPAWAAVLTAMLVLIGAAVTLIGSLGLLRLGASTNGFMRPRSGRRSGPAAS